jgi:hypothetical protein
MLAAANCGYVGSHISSRSSRRTWGDLCGLLSLVQASLLDMSSVECARFLYFLVFYMYSLMQQVLAVLLPAYSVSDTWMLLVGLLSR